MTRADGARWTVGAVLSFAAVQKLADVALGVSSHGHAIDLASAESAALPLELVVGSWLLMSSSTRSLAVAIGLLLTFAGWNVAMLFVEGGEATCGCLGSSVALPRFWTLALNGALLLMLGVALPSTAGASVSSEVGS